MTEATKKMFEEAVAAGIEKDNLLEAKAQAAKDLEECNQRLQKLGEDAKAAVNKHNQLCKAATDAVDKELRSRAPGA